MGETRIATWNLNRVRPGEPRGQRVRRQLGQQQVDVWILTETSTQLSPGPGWHGVFSAPRSKARVDERWVAVWTRGEAPEVTTADPDRTSAARVRLPGGIELIVYGTVLPWLGSPWQEHPSRGGAAFAAALEAQAADWQRLRRDHPDALLCVAGDFNQDLNDKHYYGSGRGRQKLRETLEGAGLVCLTGGDRDPVAAVTHGERGNIDHICVSHELAGGDPRSWAWPGSHDGLRGLSDHFGIGVVLSDR